MFLRTSARTNVHTDGCGYRLWDMPPLSPFISSPTFRNNVVVLSSVLGTKTRPLRCFEMPRNTDSLKHHHIPEERIRSTGTVRTAEHTRPSNIATNISMPSYYCCIRLDAQRKIRNCKLMPDSGGRIRYSSKQVIDNVSRFTRTASPYEVLSGVAVCMNNILEVYLSFTQNFILKFQFWRMIM